MEILFIVLGILSIAGGIVWACIAGYQRSENGSNMGYVKPIILGVLGTVVFILGMSFTVIPTGQVGVTYKLGVLQTERGTLGTGVQWHAPFIENIKQVSIMQQNSNEVTEENAKIWGESKNKLPVYARDIRITYQINPDKIGWLLQNVADMKELSTFGKTVQSAFSASTIGFEDIDVAKQSLVEPIMLKEMQRITDAKYGEGSLTIVRVLIGELDYEPEYQAAITARKNAEQKAQEQAVENKKNIDIATANAEAQKIKAEGDAKAILIAANAQAEANEKLTKSLSNAIILNNWIVKWDGKMPIVTDGSGNIIDISALLKDVTK